LAQAARDPARLDLLLRDLSDDEAAELLYDWPLWARTEQLPPEGVWTIWLILTGRGWGKTRVGAEFVNAETYARRSHRVALIAQDAAEARDVIVEGESGILATAPPWHYPDYEPSKRRITWPNGAVARIYTDSDPEELRGPEHDLAWVDELAKFKNSKTLWSNLMFGLRIGVNPRVVVTTTPRPVPIVRELMKHPAVVITRGTTYENRANLSEIFYTEIVREYEGTRTGRQELNGEVINPEESGIIRRSWFKLWPAYEKDKDGKDVAKQLPQFKYIVQSYDTAFTEKTLDKDTKDPDWTACTVWGVFDGPKGSSAMLLDAWRDHLGYPALKKKAIEEYRDVIYGPDKHERGADIILIEKKGSGISLVQDLQLAKLPVRAYNPGNDDKVARLNAVSHIPEHGLIYLPESTNKKRKGQPSDWCQDFLEEVCAFPLVDHDDFTDTFSQALLLLRNMRYLRVKLPTDTEEEAPAPRKPRVNPYAQ